MRGLAKLFTIRIKEKFVRDGYKEACPVRTPVLDVR
jgi:hypothetical protein